MNNYENKLWTYSYGKYICDILHVENEFQIVLMNRLDIIMSILYNEFLNLPLGGASLNSYKVAIKHL